jgi:hypothetical protein
MSYAKISKEMYSMYFGLDVFCQFEARVPEFDTVFVVQCTLYIGGEGLHVRFWDSNRQNTASPKYNDMYLFADLTIPHL